MHTRGMFGSLALMTLMAGPVMAGQGTKYGAGVTLEEITPYTRIQERPSAVEGQTIRVDGVITSVGTKTACWIGMAGGGGSDYGLPVFVRADPCTIVFPKSAVGKRVSVQGMMQPIRLDTDPAVKDAAAEYGEAETGGTPPLWEFKATGLVIQ